MAQTLDIRKILSTDPSELTAAEIQAGIQAELRGGVYEGELPLRAQWYREQSLDSPAFLATEVLDPWYKEHFEPIHYQFMDDVLGPWLAGETVRIEGVNYDPLDYTGFLGLFSRATVKSTICRIMAQWIGPYRKLREHKLTCKKHAKDVRACCSGIDSRTMFTHQVFDKAVEHSEAIRNAARHHAGWRAAFPEFRADPSREWDTKSKWRWPCFASYLATEWSFTCYGESSSKIGGHYTERIVDDWVTDESVTNAPMLEQSFARFVAMDHLRDRSRRNNPWIAVGTHYHFQDTYKRLEDQGGWLVWRVPAHTGSPKRIFDICSIDNRSDKGRKRIEVKLRQLESDPPGRLNFPKLLDWRELYRTARATSPHIYNTQILLDPVPEGEQRFDLDAIDEMIVEDIPSIGEAWIYIRCDPAISEKKDADETAIGVGLVSWTGKRFLVDGWLGREKRPTEIVKRLFVYGRKWHEIGYRVQNIGIESVQFQESLAELCRHGVPERQPTHQGESVPMLVSPCAVRSIRRSSDRTKRERILELDGPVSRRDLKIWKKCPIADRVQTYLRNFPFDKDDALDVLHDLYIGTMTPPPPMHDDRPRFPARLAHLLEPKKPGEVTGMTQTVKLANWR